MSAAGDLEEFRLVRPLGRGGMGEVFLGHDTVLDRAVAIKLIGARDPDAASRERFLTEARAIARLSHPNVVAIYRVGTTADGRPFLVQELIRGRSLDRVPRPVAWRQVCDVAIGVARGLEAAHRRGILHRDVKPANVMLDERGTPRLLDFGLAKLSSPGARGLAGEGVDGELPGRAGGLEGDATAGPAATAGAGALEVATAERVPAGDAELQAVPAAGSPAKVAPREDPAVTRAARGARAPATSSAGVAATADLPVAPAGPSAAEPRGAGGASAASREASIGASGAALGSAGPHTETGVVLGTPRYTAPEIWRGEPATAQADLYSLGVLLYELLTGEAPFPHVRLDELRGAALAGGARAVSELAPDAHPALSQVVMRCLALDPVDRPPSAGSVAHELEAAVANAPHVPAGNPYRGLRAFDAAHRGVFFGRGADVDALVDRLRSEPLVVVVGDSGIGKSSVCHAGVVPAVVAGALGDHRRWQAAALVPGRAPWAALCAALGLAPPADRDGAEAIRTARPRDGAGTLLVIDQLEELVTLSDPTEARRTTEALAAIAAGAAPAIRALVAVRGDFLTRVAALPELGAPMTRGLHLLRVLAPADLREAIVGPARSAGVSFEAPAMVDALVAAVADNPGALPLLQFTLAELWQARDPVRGVIPAAALAALGGVDGGLAAHADAVLLALGADERAAARRVALRLVTPARTRAVRDRGELLGDDDAVDAAALEALVRGRLVVARDTAAGSPVYELAHEALIRSWGTLRDWLDDVAGQHAARNRLLAAAGEWHRLGRRGDLLWTRAQLAEVRATGELTAIERAFIDASRRRAQRRTLGRAAAIAAVPLLAVGVIAGVRFEAARARDRAVRERLAAAAGHEAAAGRLARAAAEARAAAVARYHADDLTGGDARWAETVDLADAAHARFADAEAELEAAFLLGTSAVGDRMAALLMAHAELAEAMHDPTRATDLVRRIAAYNVAGTGAWYRPASLVVEIDRPARIAIHAFPAAPGAPTLAGGFAAAPIAATTGPRLAATLPAGSYLAVIEPRDGLAFRDPVLLGRGEQLVRTHRALPRAAAPPGLVYVPAGAFLYGSALGDVFRRSFLTAPALHAARTEAFWIARTEVTFAQWIEYLRALPPEERAAHAPRIDGTRGVRLTERGGRFVLAIEPTIARLEAEEGQPIVYAERTVRARVAWERMPIVGVSYREAAEYLAWLDRTGRVPGARLCTAREWERAARGADGRSFPAGEALADTDANIDATYGRRPLAYGPDEVGSFPASDSPFGVADLAGNVWELVRGAGDGLELKGGAWYFGRAAALSSNRNATEPTQRDLRVGLRVCADAARAR